MRGGAFPNAMSRLCTCSIARAAGEDDEVLVVDLHVRACLADRIGKGCARGGVLCRRKGSRTKADHDRKKEEDLEFRTD